MNQDPCNKKLKNSFYISLCVAFIDNLGVGLIYPLFAAMLFDNALPLLPMDTSQEARGIWLGIFLSLMPFAQFFSAPLWGAISDRRGRKGPLHLSLGIALVGYLFAFMGVVLSNIWILLVSRVVVGFAAGNISIVQATITDLSTNEEKVKNFGSYSMALGAGFALGPFFGGSLSELGYSTPFLFACVLTLLNLLFSLFFFKETLKVGISQPVSKTSENNLVPDEQPIEKKSSFHWSLGIDQLKKAFALKGLRTILLCSFLHNFGWAYFFEFIPVYLISKFEFSPLYLGVFYGLAGCVYALSTGLLIRPLVKRFQPETLMFGGNLLTAITILTILLLPTSFWIWPLLIVMCYFVAFVSPSSITLVSNRADSKNQGEALGVLSSINAAALAFSPLFSGSIVGKFPEVSVIIGGMTLAIVAMILFVVFKESIFNYSSQWKEQVIKN